VPGCPSLVYVGSRCEAHKAQAQDDRRPTAGRRGYDYAWQQKRARFLRLHPWCADPFEIHAGRAVRAQVVDHKMARRRGGSDDDENLQALCTRCHNRKTDQVDGGWGNG
jgi:5-methylcytosine-specific restriction protein A